MPIWIAFLAGCGINAIPTAAIRPHNACGLRGKLRERVQCAESNIGRIIATSPIQSSRPALILHPVVLIRRAEHDWQFSAALVEVLRMTSSESARQSLGA